jgi:hypothetical protein
MYIRLINFESEVNNLFSTSSSFKELSWQDMFRRNPGYNLKNFTNLHPLYDIDSFYAISRSENAIREKNWGTFILEKIGTI